MPIPAVAISDVPRVPRLGVRADPDTDNRAVPIPCRSRADPDAARGDQPLGFLGKHAVCFLYAIKLGRLVASLHSLPAGRATPSAGAAASTADAALRPIVDARPSASSIVGAASSTGARDAPACADGANTGVDATANTSANAGADPTPTAGGSGGTGLVAPNKSSKLRRRLLHHGPLASNDRLVSSVLLVPRKTMAAIVDPARRVPVDEEGGIVAERLRTVIKHAVAPCDVAIKKNFYVRKAAGGLQGGRVRAGVDRPASMDVRRPFQCRLKGCGVVGHVEWDLPDDDDGDGDVAVHVNISGQRTHFQSEEIVGVPELRGESRRQAVGALAAQLGHGIGPRAVKPTAMYNESLLSGPAMGGVDVIRKARREVASQQRDPDVLVSLTQMNAESLRRPVEETFLQGFAQNGADVKVTTFYEESIRCMRDAIDSEGSIFVDTTGNVILPVPLRDDQQNKRVYTTALSVVVPCSGARRSKPLRVVTEHSTTTVSSNTKETLLLLRRAESRLFGNNRVPRFIGADCEEGNAIAALDVYNNTSIAEYAAVLFDALRRGSTATEEARRRGWALLAWCLYHVKSSLQKHCRAIVGDDRAVRAKLVMGTFERVRRATTIGELDKNTAIARAVFGATTLAALGATAKVLFQPPTNGNSGYVSLPELSIAMSVSSTDPDAPNPFRSPTTLAYFNRQWFNSNVVFYANVFIGERLRQCDATSEVRLSSSSLVVVSRRCLSSLSLVVVCRRRLSSSSGAVVSRRRLSSSLASSSRVVVSSRDATRRDASRRLTSPSRVVVTRRYLASPSRIGVSRVRLASSSSSRVVVIRRRRLSPSSRVALSTDYFVPGTNPLALAVSCMRGHYVPTEAPRVRAARNADG